MPPTGEMNLKAIIETALDAKGFEDFKAGLAQVKGKTEEAGKGAEGSGGAFERLGKKLPHTSFKLLSYELVNQMGLHGHLRPIVMLTSGAMDSLAASTGVMGSALAGATLGLTILIPMLLSMMNASDDAGAAAARAAVDTDGLVTKYEEMTRKGIPLTRSQQQYLDILRQIQKEERKRAEESIVAAIAAQEKLIQSTMGLWAVSKMYFKETADFYRGKRETLSIDERINKITGEARLEQERLGAELENLRAAHEAGFKSAEDQAEAEIRGAEAAADARKAANDKVARDTQTFLDHQRKAEAIQAALDKKQFLDRQHNIEAGLLKNAALAKKIAAEHERQTKEQAALDKKAAEDKIQFENDVLAAKLQTANATVGMLGALFGKSKAAAIVQTIINTSAAAVAAISPPNPPLPYSAPFLAAALAVGAGQLATIRSQKAGFDDPGNDAIVAQAFQSFGRKWAQDMTSIAVSKASEGFREGFRGPGGASRGSSVVHNTTIDRGTHIENANFNGLLGTPGQAMLELERRQIRSRRVENRTRRRSKL